MPQIVKATEWQAARAALLTREKELTHALDALAAERRRLPMVALDTGKYRFTGQDGNEVGLADLFDGYRQLIIYHFMLQPGQADLCGGCCTFTDNLAAGQWHLNARETRLVLVAPAPQDDIQPVVKRFGWTVPFYSAQGNAFNEDLGVGYFGVSVLLRHDDQVFRTYFTTDRGVDRLRMDFNLLDLTPYGRQEVWEDSPEGWPQEPTMAWLRLHDEY
jgi:predicted dithiol-disulfide oxidoreductase (DUF899 family)